MERKSEKRRGKYVMGQQAILPIVKYTDDDENSRMTDNCWKYRQGNEIIAGNERNERRQTNPSVDHSTSYYCPTAVQRPTRKHGISSSSRIKYVAPSINEEFYDGGKNRTMRLSRNQLLRQYANNNCANNIALVRKNRYIDDFDEVEEDVETIPYKENENLAEETSEEIDNRREVPVEFNGKDYEEDEADDEIDEESDALDRQVDRMRAQRKIRMDSLPRSQRISSAVLPSRYHRAGKIGFGKSSERCSRGSDDHENAGIPTEEENDEEPEVPTVSFPSRKSALRSRHSEDNWISGRNSIERYAELPERSLIGSENRQQARRTRTSRPEMETMMRSGIHHESARNIKCNRCGGTPGQTPKTTSSRNATCRLEDSRYFIDETIGDEIIEEPSNPIYHTKPRRSKESRSPIYEPDDKGQTFDEHDDDDDDDEIGPIYKTCRGKNVRQTNARRSSMRASDRHDEKSTSKNNKRYWT